MYWFTRPPYLRYAFSVLLLLTAIWLDIRPDRLVEYPFAVVDIAAGDEPNSATIEWRRVSAAGLPAPVTRGDLAAAPRFARSVHQGDPILSSDLGSGSNRVPPEWWVLSLDLPPEAVPGQAVQIVIIPAQGIEAPAPIPAVVVSSARADPGLLGSGEGTGQVAVPPEHAATAATAAAGNRVSVLLSAAG